MRGGDNRGYTIIEVMIFLAISGVMFLIAAVFISGKQAAAQYTQGINSFASQLQSTIQAIADGQFTTSDSVRCVASGGALSITNTAGTAQGTNDGCVFLGKVVHLAVKGDGKNYELFTVAGLQLDPLTSQPIADPRNAKPTPVYNSDHSLDQFIDSETVPQDLQVTGVKSYPADTTKPPVTSSYAFGLFSTASDTSFKTGNQAVQLYYFANVPNSASEDTTAAYNHVIANPATNMVPAKQVTICIDDGNRHAAINIGANNSQMNVTIDRESSTAC